MWGYPHAATLPPLAPSLNPTLNPSPNPSASPGDDVAGGSDDEDDEEGGGGAGGSAAAAGARSVLGPDGVVDIEAVRRRMRSTVAVLDDFNSRRAAGRSRADYMDQVGNRV